MLKTYFKIAFRNLWRYRTFSFINILGLAIGIAACFLIFLYTRFELSYDRFHRNTDRIYRLVNDVKTPEETFHWYTSSGPAGNAIKSEFPQVQSVTRVIPANLLVRKGNFKFQEENGLWADPTFFDIFDFPLKSGDAKTALKEPNSIIFSETAAHKYFGDSNPVGQSLLLTGLNLPVIVTGIMKDIPENSHLQADMLVSMSTFTTSFNPYLNQDWTNFNCYTYLLLAPGTNPDKIQRQLPDLVNKYADDELRKTGTQCHLFLEPLKNVYLRSLYGAPVSGNLNNVYIFSLIALFILLIACINFVNLTTARSVERAKEVGIRKTAGARRNQLIVQFLIESSIISLLSLFLALLFCYLLLPLFNRLSGKTISPYIFEHPYYVVILFLLSLAIGFLAGLYPAYVLSSFKPVLVLKGRFATGQKGNILRKALVISQFTVSIMLLVGTIVVYTQLKFMRSYPLGFSQEQILAIDNHGDSNIDAFKQALSQIPAIESSSVSSAIPGRDYSDNGNDMDQLRIENRRHELQLSNLISYNVDYDFLSLFKIKIIAGRDFSKAFSTDSAQALILNESAVKSLGYTSPEQAIGKRFVYQNNTGIIIGVIDDFHFHSLKEAVKPMCLRIKMGYWEYTSIKINSSHLPDVLKIIENKWNKTIPNRPFNYFFLDDAFEKQYRSESRFGDLFLYFSMLAIFISCLGLLGLAAYSTQQRTKEIGIRKVLGASISHILNLILKDFLKLVVLSFILASPIAWFATYHWLLNFAYRTPIHGWMFALAGLTALLIAFLTVSYQAIKAAIANPVKSLKTE